MEEVWKTYKVSKPHNRKARVYEVSNMGNVRVNGELVQPYVHCGYLTTGGKAVHRMVAELFVENPDNKSAVDHINTNKFDNRACNLRWVTQKENCNNPLSILHYSNANRGENNPMARRKKNV